MSEQYTGSDAWTDTYTLPKDGEAWNFATVMTAVVKKAIDSLKSLRTHKAWVDQVNSFTAAQTFTTATANTVTAGTAQLGAVVLSVGAANGIQYRELVLADSNTTVTVDRDSYRVPQITANRIYDLGAGSNIGQRVRITRPRSTDAFSVTITLAVLSTLAVFNPSASGWVEFEWNGTTWVATSWAGGVSSLVEAV